MLIYLSRLGRSCSEKAVLELSGRGLRPRKGIGFTALEDEPRSKLIALLAISLTPVLTWEMELFAISTLEGCFRAALELLLVRCPRPKVLWALVPHSMTPRGHLLMEMG